MSTKVLVAYASKSGSTVEVAEFMGKVLQEAGTAVDVLPIKKVKTVAGYGVAFVGSAIRVGKWLEEAVKFVEANKAGLQAIPTAFFTLCMTLNEDTPEHRAEVSAYLDPVRAVHTSQAEGFFAGVMELGRLGFIERAMMGMMKPPQGDFRDWDAIRAWTQETYTRLAT
jgi:menaquinone-dependent protoporphyrinogen oxidase